MAAMQARWDIFCRVIDNYGDVGVCWRLARQLAAEHGLAVRLWVDDLAALAPMAPGIPGPRQPPGEPRSQAATRTVPANAGHRPRRKATDSRSSC